MFPLNIIFDNQHFLGFKWYELATGLNVESVSFSYGCYLYGCGVCTKLAYSSLSCGCNDPSKWSWLTLLLLLLIGVLRILCGVFALFALGLPRFFSLFVVTNLLNFIPVTPVFTFCFVSISWGDWNLARLFDIDIRSFFGDFSDFCSYNPVYIVSLFKLFFFDG